MNFKIKMKCQLGLYKLVCGHFISSFLSNRGGNNLKDFNVVKGGCTSKAA